MTIYLDTSAVLRGLLGTGKPLPEWGTWNRAYSSEIMGVEARRALDRLRLSRSLDDDGLADAHEAIAATERAIGSIRLTSAVLRRASQPMPTVSQNARCDPSSKRPALRGASRGRSRVWHARPQPSDSGTCPRLRCSRHTYATVEEPGSEAKIYRQFGAEPAKADDKRTVDNFRTKCLRELRKIKLAWPGLNYATAKGVLILSPSKPAIAPTTGPQRLVE